MNHPNVMPVRATGASSADDALICTVLGIEDCNEHVLKNSAAAAGIFDVEVTDDPTGATGWTDSAALPMAVYTGDDTSPGTLAVEVTQGQRAILTGRFAGIRLRQKGATAVSAASITSYPARR